MRGRRVHFILLVLSILLTLRSYSNDTLTNRQVVKNFQPNLERSHSQRQLKRVFPSFQATTSAPFKVEADYPTLLARPATSGEEELRGKIEATFNKVMSENRFIDFLDASSLIELPVGLPVDIGVLRYVILIDSVVMTPTESFLYASMVFETPQGKRIHFMGSDIKFSRTGGLSGDGKLMLVGNYPIPLDGDKSELVIKGDQHKTFVEFDCRGYKQLSLDASLVFSRRLLIPEDPDGQEGKGNVTIDFTTTVADFSDVLINVNVPKFRVASLEDVTFSVTDAVLDLSDARNATSVKFPAGYEQLSPQFVGGNMNLWRGVYLREVTVTLPPQFGEKDEKKQSTSSTKSRISFVGNDIILDHIGFSGNVSANNLIPIDKGKLGNWNYSLEKIYINLVANEIKEAGFNGQVNIPLNKVSAEGTQGAPAAQVAPETPGTQASIGKGKYFKYTALIKPGNEYLFTVTNSDKLDFDLWKAEVTLNPSSYIEIRLADKKFLPKAHLNGVMTVNAGLQNGIASSDINKNAKFVAKFEGLEVQTVKPYVKVGSFSLGSPSAEQKMGGFPITINEIKGSSTANTLTLGIDLTLSLVGEGDGGFAANGRFNIISEYEEKDDYLYYRFKDLNIERFGIDIDKGAFKFKGALNFYKEDPVYGNGISGIVDATFNPGVRLQASAIFGTRNGMRYWFADAMAEFKSGITVFPGFAFYGFGGGAYYHMKMDDKGVGSALGKTVSGIVYVPDETVHFGFKATVSMGVQPGEKSFNGDATFEMAFNSGGGLRYINFRGNGYFMTPPLPGGVDKIAQKAAKIAAAAKKLGITNLNEGSSSATEEIYGSPSQAGERASVWASLMINYDFDNRILHGNLSAYINVAQGLIKGGGLNNKAGEAVLHFAPNEWYIYIGRPEYENRFAIEVLGIARLDAYFVIGSVIPDSPPPPENVSSILGGMDLSYMDELNALSDGAGVGFGASFRVDTGDLTFMMFYGRFAAGLGFDIMLKNYGDAECKGGGRLGVNGWYANGQAYAYFEGKIGIKVKVFRKTKRVNILEVGAAVVAQAKLPNPTWVKGVAGGHFKVLGGLVKGNCKFEIEIGKECEIIRKDGSSPLESIDVIAQITPSDNATQVDVFTVPQAVFNYEMEKEYEMVDDNDQIIKFKISLDEIAVKENGTPLKAELKWNEDRTVAALNPFEILPSEKDLTLDVVTSFKENKSGYWVTTMSDGAPLKEKRSVPFKTGKAPDYVPEHNVAYSYPSINQYNYYKGENSQGYITLKQGQKELFEKSDLWDQVIRFTPHNGQPIEVPFNYQIDSKELQFSLSSQLQNEQVYALEVVNVPKGLLKSIDSNVDTVNAVMASVDGNDLGIRTRKAEGTIKEIQEKVIFSTHFRTSKYNTFSEKVLSINPSSGWRDPIVAGVHAIGSNIGGTEPFSNEEIYGSDRNAPLIQMEADLSNVSWFNNEVNPIVYQDYPINGVLKISAENRDPNVLGVVPTKGVYLYQYPYSFTLSNDIIESGVVSPLSTVGRFDYYLAFFMYYDYLDLAGQAANYVVSHGNSTRLNKLITSTFPVIRKGDYWVNIRYVLPGKNTISSTYRHKIYNPID